MSGENVDVGGHPLAPEDVSIARARDLVRRLLGDQIPYAALVGCRSGGGLETVIMDVDVQVPQRPVHDIRQCERLAVRFERTDTRMPDVTPIRADFPTVPHLNLTGPGDPKSICLFEEPYREIRPRLTAALLVERIREWLRLTARGGLHAADQPLEPLLVGAAGQIIVAHAILSQRNVDEPPIALTVSRRENWRGGLVLVAERAARESFDGNRPSFSVDIFWAMPRAHGALTVRPRSLAALHAYLRAGDDDLLGHLRETLRRWYQIPAALDARLVLIVVAPKTR